jgi:ADP-ribosylglycohydrolase
MRAGSPARPPANAGALMADPRLHARRAPGNTCLAALAQSFTRGRLATVEDPPNGSKGCGAVMRSAPFGLAARDRAEAFREARDAGVLTHGHPSGYLSAAYFAAVVFDVARDAPLADAMRRADELLAVEAESGETRAAIEGARRVAAHGAPSRAALEGLGGGWVGEEALAIAIACALTAGDGVAAALWRSVVHGGDSDSTGSLTGNLLGAMRGEGALPAAWLAELELRDVVERVARELHEVTAST